MATQLQPLEFAPGINKNTTPYHNETGWVAGDKVRFSSGKPQKLGGWTKEVVNTFEGVARDILSWVSLESKQYLSLGTHKRLYILDGGTYFDITPIRQTSTPTNPYTTTNASADVSVNVTGHNAIVGDSVIISGGSAVGGITLSGEYEVKSVTDTNNFIIEHTSAATSSVSGGGGSPTLEFLLSVGLEYNTAAFGWGASTYGSGTWGTARTASSLTTQMRQWSLADWGEDLLACVRGGAIYHWEENSGTSNRADILSSAPAKNNFIAVVSPARHLVSFGCTNTSSVFDPMLIRWADSESLSTWIPAVTNSAGSQRLDVGNYLVGAQISRTDTLVFTDIAAYTMTYQGPPFIFGFNLIGSNAGLISQHASVNVNGVVYWLSNNSLYRYDGVLRQIPISIEDVLFESGHVESINYDQKEMIYAGVNQEFNEIIWVYPSGTSTKCDRYFIYNYLEDIVYDGTIDRTTWEEPKIFDKPVATSSDGMLFTHENGENDDSTPMQSFIESGDFDLGEGDQFMFIDKLIPDFEQQGNINFTLCTKKYPYSTEEVEKTYVITPTSGHINMRARGRHGRIKIESNTTNGDFQLGKPRLSMRPDGGR